jgi:hypothetical protein
MIMKILLALLVVVVTATAGETNTPPQLAVNLTDGSRIVGTAELPALVVRSEALGRIEIPLAKVRGVKFDANHESATVALNNGDRMQGAIGVESVALQTLVGRVTIPLHVVRDLAVTAAPTDAGLREGLVAYYPFNGDAKDYSGNENHGKVVGAEFAEAGLRFKGNSSTYVVVRRSDALEPTKGITISMWAKGIAGSGYGTLLRKSDHCRPGYMIRGGGPASAQLPGENPCGRNFPSVSFRPFAETRWQNLVATYSPEDGSVTSYHDGELVEQKPQTGLLLHSGDLYIGGAVADSLDGGFCGTMAEVRLYNRALTEAEIRALAAQPPAGQ